MYIDNNAGYLFVVEMERANRHLGEAPWMIRIIRNKP